MAYRRNASASSGKVNERERLRGAYGPLADAFLFRFPLVDQVTIVDLPGMEILAKETEPGRNNAPQYARFYEQEVKAFAPLAKAFTSCS